MNVDLKEFRSAFVAEADEHLTAIRSLLLTIERSIREHPPRGTQRELRELMRLLHTVKGLAAMVGVEPIVAITHSMETVVRTSERAGISLSESAVEALLGGTSAIEARVRAVADNRPPAAPPTDLLAALAALEPSATPTREAPAKIDPALATRLSASELAQLEGGVKDGRKAIRVDFAPSASKVTQGLSITSVRERLAEFAEIVKVLPATIPPSDAAPGGLVFTLVLLTDASAERVAEAVGVAAEDVVVVLASEPAASNVSPGWVSEEEDDRGTDGGRGVLRVEVGRVDDAIEMLGGLVVTRSRIALAVERLEASGADTRELRALMNDDARQLRDLRASILRVRMIPMTTVVERLPLVVRGLGRSSSKEVRIALDVGSAELDKSVAERLFPALVHLVRNAIAHGIELPEERRAAGKPASGLITVTSTTVGRNVEIRLTDDGRGVDRAAVAARAGVAIPQNEAGLLDLLCRPGVSTQSEADTTSGRGVGMDVVRKVIVRELGGELSLETEPGKRTTFVLRVPLTVAIVDGFTIRSAGERFVIPVSIVEEIVELAGSRVVASPGSQRGLAARFAPKLLARRGTTIPIFDLAAVLGLPAAGDASHGLLVRSGAGELVGYAVDRVLGQQEIVVRPLADSLVSTSAVSGSTDLGDGRATVVLDLLALATTIEAEGRAA